MLRASSSAFEYDLNESALVNESVDPGVPGGRELIDFVDAVLGVRGDPDEARAAVIATLDGESLFDAATVFGNFEMMNRIAEASGIRVPPQYVEREAETLETLGIAAFEKT